MPLRGIPPAQRRRRAPGLSSMKSAYRFVGGPIGISIGSAAGAASRGGGEQDTFKAHVSPPNPRVRQAREQRNKALQDLRDRYQELLGSAEDPTEQAFWEAALKRLVLNKPIGSKEP